MTLVQFVIEPRLIEGALRELADQATEQAERVLLRKRIAGAEDRAPGEDITGGMVIVSGTVRMPIPLPPGPFGFAADRQRGTFTLGKLIMRGPKGATFAEQEVEVPWRDGRWVGGGRARCNARLDNALPDMARKAADRAVRKLADVLREGRYEGSDHKDL